MCRFQMKLDIVSNVVRAGKIKVQEKESRLEIFLRISQGSDTLALFSECQH